MISSGQQEIHSVMQRSPRRQEIPLNFTLSDSGRPTLWYRPDAAIRAAAPTTILCPTSGVTNPAQDAILPHVRLVGSVTR
jgi:hypothetical protein